MVPTEDIIKMADFELTIFLNSVLNFISKYQARLLGLNFYCRMLAFSWSILKQSFKNTNNKTLVMEKIHR